MSRTIQKHPDEEVWDCVSDCPCALLDAQSGNRPGMSGGGKHRPDYEGGMFGALDSTTTARDDEGGASRFFKQVAIDPDELPLFREAANRFYFKGKVKPKERGSENDHATVKPVELMRYLARLILPPNPGRILVPFCGSGSEMLGCMLAGWPEVVGIELEEPMSKVCRWRIENATIRTTTVHVT